MNFDEVEVVELELKYCERCGGLWLRLCEDAEVYCASCRMLITRMPLARRLRWPVNRDTDVQAGSPFMCEGGTA